MLQFSKYERPATVEEALAIVQKVKGARVIGGGVWLRLQDRRIARAIDLSACGLDLIERVDWETGAPATGDGPTPGDAWGVGAMVTLHQLEVHGGFNASTCGVYESAVRDIVGVQMRNVATVGGSLFGRFGFSDILTALLPLECEVELAGEGRVPLAEFAARKAYERDILTRVLVRDARDLRAGFACVRRSATDFSVLNVCAASVGGSWRVAVGARPGRAVLLPAEAVAALSEALTAGVPQAPAATVDGATASLSPQVAAALDAACEAASALPLGSNMRGSARYRRHLAAALTRRVVLEAAGLLAPAPAPAPAARPQAGAAHAAAQVAASPEGVPTPEGGEA